MKGEENENPDSIHTFSSIDFVCQCMIDRERTEAFGKAIEAKVKPGMQVLDMGTGSGIMALFAARAGAEHVTALEYDHYVAQVARDIIAKNGFEKKITVIEVDARMYSHEGASYDVVIAEMLTAGMVDEYQVQAMNNLHEKKALKEKITFIPTAQESYVTLGHHDFEHYGFKLAITKHLWRRNPPKETKFDALTDAVLLSRINFFEVNDESFSKTIDMKIVRPGTVNCVRLSSVTILTDAISIGDTDSLNAPMAIPIPPRSVKAGEHLSLVIHYTFGAGYAHFTAEVQS